MLIESALDRPLVAEVRAQLRVLAEECINETFGEKHAPFVDDVDAIVAKIRSAAKSLEQALAGSSRNATERSARVYLGVAYQEQGAERAGLDPFRRDLSALILAASQVRRRLVEMEGLREGDAWVTFVRKTTRLFKSFDLPFGASKSGELSPYLRFLRAFAAIDPAFARHTKTDSALQTAVSRAREKRLGRSPGFSTDAKDPDGASATDAEGDD